MKSKLAWVVLLAVAGCAESTEPETGPVGSLSVALSATSANGDIFRLRNATFEISGCSDGAFPFPGGSGAAGSFMPNCTTIRVSSEENPDAATITKRLIPGYYTVSMFGDWYLEEASGSGWTRVERVVLLTPTVQSTYVWDGSQTQVSYAFGVDGELVDFRHGDLSISIQVEHPGDHGPYAGSGAGSWAPPLAGSGPSTEAGTSAPPPAAGSGG